MLLSSLQFDDSCVTVLIAASGISNIPEPVPKRPKLAFEDDVNMKDDLPAEYQRWTNWRAATFPMAVVFLNPEDRGVLVATYHTKLMMDGLSLEAVDRVVRWDDPDSQDPAETLLAVTLFEKT